MKKLQRVLLIAMIPVITIILVFVFLSMPTFGVRAQTSQAPVVVLTLKGPLTPIWVEYINRGLILAEERRAAAVILQLDTPGGATDTMEIISKQLRASKTPVVVFVYPRGSMAASAGTIITLSGHLAAMAPETTIGAASPVGGQGEEIDTTEATKVKEVMKASVRTLAKNRPPQAIKLAEETIQSARAVNVEEALAIGLVDFEAVDIDDLLTQLDGHKAWLSDDVSVVLQTRGAPVLVLENTFIEEMLQLLTNPNIVFLLLSIGVQALLIELSSPGGWVAGFIGVVALLLSIYGMGVLPVNWFGLLFLVLAFVLFVLDIKAPTHGALTVAGAASFITGALVLFNSSRVPGFPPVSTPLVIGTGIVIAASFFVAVTFAIRAQKTPLKTGSEILPGQIGYVTTELKPTGQVKVTGEIWSAEIDTGTPPLPVGTKIEVVARDGLRLKVRNHIDHI